MFNRIIRFFQELLGLSSKDPMPQTQEMKTPIKRSLLEDPVNIDSQSPTGWKWRRRRGKLRKRPERPKHPKKTYGQQQREAKKRKRRRKRR